MPGVRRSTTLALTIGLISCVAPCSLTAQQTPAATGRLLLATVVDLSGRTQVDFGVDDFVIREGGDEREVLDVHVADYPLVVLIDDASESNDIGPIKAAVSRFITRVGERPVAVGTLSNPSGFVASLEDSREDVLDRVASMTGQPGSADTLPAVAHAARVLQDTGSPFSAIVIVTARAIDARTPVEGDLLPGIADSGATVHVVESQPPQAALPDGTAIEEVPDLLRVLSDQTHGQYTKIFTAASYSTALDRLADKLSVEMMIQYLVPANEVGGDVQVGVRRPGSRVVGLGVK